MRNHLVFTLAAPLVSHGDVAGHQHRGGNAWPGRSAVLGLVGAALGLERADVTAQRALAEGYGVAVLVRRAGDILRDFHTVQTVPSAKVKRPATRADALARGRALKNGLHTLVTVREYRTDAVFEACLYERGAPDWLLEELAEALRRPRFVLYLGRKSCPLAAPLDPRIVAAEDVLAALAAPAPKSEIRTALHIDAPGETVITDVDGLAAVPHSARRERRWDNPVDRLGWHFAPRDAVVIPLKVEEAP